MRYHGYHLGAWRHPGVPADGTLDFKYFLNTARLAERAKFDMVFFADGIGIRVRDEPEGSLCRSPQTVELEPLTLLSAIATHTENIGLVATASTTYNEPYHIARKYASLDHISGGRAGWNIVTSWSDEEARNFGRDKHLDYDARYERAAEFVQVVTGLWNSWETMPVRDKASGLYFDPEKLHVLNHKGNISVRGPLIRPRRRAAQFWCRPGPPNGQDIAEVMPSARTRWHSILARPNRTTPSLKSRAIRFGRSPDAIKVPARVHALCRPHRGGGARQIRRDAPVDPP